MKWSRPNLQSWCTSSLLICMRRSSSHSDHPKIMHPRQNCRIGPMLRPEAFMFGNPDRMSIAVEATSQQLRNGHTSWKSSADPRVWSLRQCNWSMMIGRLANPGCIIKMGRRQDTSPDLISAGWQYKISWPDLLQACRYTRVRCDHTDCLHS